MLFQEETYIMQGKAEIQFPLSRGVRLHVRDITKNPAIILAGETTISARQF